MLAFRQKFDLKERRFLSIEAVIAGLVIVFALGGDISLHASEADTTH